MDTADTLTETEREALHEVELGVENLHRAHGHLVSFHHSTGRAMDHLAVAEEVAATGNPVQTPAALLSGGETTVTVRGNGVGGPNQEFALRAAMELPPGAVLACVDTDGEDGSTGAAGALVDSETVDDLAAAREALADNDAYGYLDSRGALLVTGPTGTNVNDLRVLLVPDS